MERTGFSSMPRPRIGAGCVTCNIACITTTISNPAASISCSCRVWFVVPNLTITFLIAGGIIGDWQSALSVVLGSMLGLFHYEWVHYVAHIPYRPRTSFGRWMKKYHLWHHFKNEHYWFGVSNPVLDAVHRTYRDPEAVPRSTTARGLDIWGRDRTVRARRSSNKKSRPKMRRL